MKEQKGEGKEEERKSYITVKYIKKKSQVRNNLAKGGRTNGKKDYSAPSWDKDSDWKTKDKQTG